MPFGSRTARAWRARTRARAGGLDRLRRAPSAIYRPIGAPRRRRAEFGRCVVGRHARAPHRDRPHASAPAMNRRISWPAGGSGPKPAIHRRGVPGNAASHPPMSNGADALAPAPPVREARRERPRGGRGSGVRARAARSAARLRSGAGRGRAGPGRGRAPGACRRSIAGSVRGSGAVRGWGDSSSGRTHEQCGGAASALRGRRSIAGTARQARLMQQSRDESRISAGAWRQAVWHA